MPVIAHDLIDRLAQHRTLSGAPRTELEWLAAHGSIRNLNTGDALSRKDRPGGGPVPYSLRTTGCVCRSCGRAEQIY
jgi:hypothetical protein